MRFKVPFIDDKQDAKAEAHEEAHDEAHADSHADATGHADHAADGQSSDGYSLDEGMSHYMDAGHLFGHVQDSYYIELPRFLTGGSAVDEHGQLVRDANGEPVKEAGKLKIPNLTGSTVENPMFPYFVGRPSKFMVLELLAALIIAVAYIWLARKVSHDGKAPKGKVWNFLESIVCFIRDDIARPTIGKQDADRYMPFLLTLFFFVIVLNLLGMVPSLGAATSALAVTAVLAIVTFVIVMGVGMKKMGVVGFLKAQVPHMDLSPALAIILIPSIWAIEIFGLFVKHFVLAIRLFANMFAGHLVLAVFLGFIGVTWASWMVWAVGPVVVLVAVALSLLELFVACLQAYVFTFLAALFIGAAQHPH